METKQLIIFAIIIIVIIAILIRIAIGKRTNRKSKTEIEPEHIAELAAYVKMQKEQQQQELLQKELKRAEQKQKLEAYKQTKEQLKSRLEARLDTKSWLPIKQILNTIDKGGVGIYILYNKTKNKYYVGQAKQLQKRIKEHFSIEPIAMDYLSGDTIEVKLLTANELDTDYRLDHIEKTAIEIYSSDKYGYNKTAGNL